LIDVHEIALKGLWQSNPRKVAKKSFGCSQNIDSSFPGGLRTTPNQRENKPIKKIG